MIETVLWGTITWSEMGKQSKKVNPCRPQIDLSKIYELFFKEQSNSGIHSLLQIACKHLQKLGGGILSNFSSILFIIYMFMRVRSEKPCLGDSMKCYYYCEVKKSLAFRIPRAVKIRILILHGAILWLQRAIYII